MRPSGWSPPRWRARGFTLVENLVAAAVMGIILSSMAQLLMSFSKTGTKTMEGPYAQSLADRVLDTILADLATENSLAFMTEGQRYDRAYRLQQQGAQVTQYFFDLFPDNGRPIEAPANRALAAIPTKVVGGVLVLNVDNLYGAWFNETPFGTVFKFNNSGRELSAVVDDQADFASSIADPTGVRYVVRLQCFGLSEAAMRRVDSGANRLSGISESANAIHVGADVSGVLPSSGISAEAYALLADSAIGSPRTSGLLDTGRLFVYDSRAGRPATGGFRSEFTDCLTRILVARTYPAKSYAGDWGFVSGGKVEKELASASVVISGRVLGQ